MSESENPQSYPRPQWHGSSALALMGNMRVSTAFFSWQWNFPFFFHSVKGHSTPVYGALSRHGLLLFVSYPACVYDMNRQWLIITDGCAAVGCTRQQWRRMHGNAESWNWIRWSCFFVPSIHSASWQLSAGVLFVFNPVAVQMGVESPDALTSLHQQSARIINKQIRSQFQGFSIHSNH